MLLPSPTVLPFSNLTFSRDMIEIIIPRHREMRFG